MHTQRAVHAMSVFLCRHARHLQRFAAATQTPVRLPTSRHCRARVDAPWFLSLRARRPLSVYPLGQDAALDTLTGNP